MFLARVIKNVISLPRIFESYSFVPTRIEKITIEYWYLLVFLKYIAWLFEWLESEWRSFSCGKWVEIKPSVDRNRNQTSFATSDLICYNYQSIWMSSERKSDAIKNKLNWNFRKTNVIYRRLAVLAYIKIVNKTSAPLNVNSKRLCSVSRRTKFTQRSRNELHFSSSRGNFVGEILRWEKNSSRASKTSNSTKNLMHLNG